MKPLFLSFSGLNSYRQKQDIDFTQLTAGGIFGIFGPTGAGKSTVLDAITLALYGKVDRARNKAQGIINLSENRCLVDFTFALAGKKYLVQRVLEREKDKQFSAKTKSCRLYCVDDDEVLAEQSREVSEQIEQLLGMDFERFSQAVILPQGKFDAFLRLDPGDRANFLEQLFHLHEYGDNLSRKARNLLAFYREQKSLAQSRFDMMADCSEEKIEVSRRLQEEKRQALQVTQNSLKQLQKSLQKWRLLADKAQQLQKTQQEWQKLVAQKDEMEASANKLSQAKKAQSLGPLIKDAQDLVKKSKNLAQQLQSLRQEEQSAQEAAAAAHKRLQAAESVLENGRKDILIAIDKLANLLDEEQNHGQLQQAIARQEAALQPLLADEHNMLQKQAGLQQALVTIATAEDDLCRLKDDLYEKWQQADANWRQQQKHNMAAFLATGLNPGQPCPVCGSSHHPQPYRGAAADDGLQQLQDLVQKLQENWQVAQQKWQQKGQQHKKAQQDLLILHNELASLRQQLQAAQAALHEQKNQQSQLAARLQEAGGGHSISRQKSLLENRLQDWQKEETKARTEQKERQDMLVKVQNDYARKQALYEDVLSSLDLCKADLLRQATDSGFQSGTAAQKALLDGAEMILLEKELTDYYDELKGKDSRMRELCSELEGSLYDDEKLFAAEAAVKEQESRERSLVGDLALAEENYNRLLAQQEEWQKLRQDMAEFARKEELAARLAKLLQGRAFVNFLARGQLQRLLAAASETLAQLSNHRYLLEIFDDDRNSDFMMVDNYNGGGRRPVSTLSGGEIFLVSLSLALALSARIQMQGAPLEFFFLDEGFGTLDPQKLEMVMEALEMLPSAKRQVGIISHVQELRNRLPRYLEAIPATDDRGSYLCLRTN
jgi:exonuclease SbcC